MQHLNRLSIVALTADCFVQSDSDMSKVQHSKVSIVLLNGYLTCCVQVPIQLDGKRFPDPLEADTTVTNAPDKALPKDKAQ